MQPIVRKSGARLACGVLGLLLLGASCNSPGSTHRDAHQVDWLTTPDVPITEAPYQTVHANWKQRLDEAYVYVEHVGDYREIGVAIRALMETAQAQGLAPSGPLFGLYFDDPGQVPIERLRARACLPVAGPLSIEAPLRYDVLPGQPVVYAVVAGAYQEIPRAYPGLLTYLAERGWVEDGPWREIYLNPESAAEPSKLLTEVQVPWTVP